MSTTTETGPRGNQLEQRVEELEAKLEEKDERIEEQAQRIDELEAELKEYREHNEKDKANVKKRITNLEQDEPADREQDADRGDRGTGSTDEEPGRGRTPLDQVVSLPEHVVQQELTENQDRARFIAKDILDYATKAPAGYVVTSSDIRTILAAKEDGTPHTETVSRVMNFLDRFGRDEVEIVKRRGKRRVVFTKESATRFHNADARDQEEITGVVMGKATG